MANKTLTLLSKAFNLAEMWGWRPEGTNPCRHVQRFKEEGRERYLSASLSFSALARFSGKRIESRTQRPTPGRRRHPPVDPHRLSLIGDPPAPMGRGRLREQLPTPQRFQDRQAHRGPQHRRPGDPRRAGTCGRQPLPHPRRQDWWPSQHPTATLESRPRRGQYRRCPRP